MEAHELKAFLSSHGLTQNGAARTLGINERTMRRYVAGDLVVPKMLVLALRGIVDENRRRGDCEGIQDASKGAARFRKSA